MNWKICSNNSSGVKNKFFLKINSEGAKVPTRLFFRLYFSFKLLKFKNFQFYLSIENLSQNFKVISSQLSFELQCDDTPKQTPLTKATKIWQKNYFSSFFFPAKIPARFNVGVMLFMACFTAYMLRTNISINLIAMVEDTNNNTNGPLPDVTKTIFQKKNWLC